MAVCDRNASLLLFSQAGNIGEVAENEVLKLAEGRRALRGLW